MYLRLEKPPVQKGFSEERLWPDNYLVSWLEVIFWKTKPIMKLHAHRWRDVVMESVDFVDVLYMVTSWKLYGYGCKNAENLSVWFHVHSCLAASLCACHSFRHVVGCVNHQLIYQYTVQTVELTGRLRSPTCETPWNFSSTWQNGLKDYKPRWGIEDRSKI